MLYSIRSAAARVKRTPRTIEAWIADGHLPVALVVEGRRYVLEDALLACYRDRLLSGKSPKPRPTSKGAAAAPPRPARARAARRSPDSETGA